MTHTINHAAVAKLLYGKVPAPDMIPIYPDLRRRAEMVATKARLYVGKDSGRTAASIDVNSTLRGPVWNFRIEAHTRYAYYHHQGTRPHIITGGVGGVVTFRSHGRIVHTRIVHHPGFHGNPFLSRALPEFMLLRDKIARLP